MGLGDVYAEEYARQMAKKASSGPSLPDEAQTAEQKALEKELLGICRGLEALCNGQSLPSYMKLGEPKSGAEEAISVLERAKAAGAPALALEENVPVSVSAAGLLAPEEIYDGRAAAGNCQGAPGQCAGR